MYFLGIDLGSSSIKIALVDRISGRPLAVLQEPQKEMSMYAPQQGWAEQNPNDWWHFTCKGIQRIIEENKVTKEQILGIGIAYQMHGLVVVDKDGNPLRNAIIWCDSRAVGIGNKAYSDLGHNFCDGHLLNSPGNFTASKLRWVQENEPETFAKIHKFMLPGDFLAFRFSDKINTTVSGLSEAILWDFKKDQISQEVLGQYTIPSQILPDVVDTFSEQATVSTTGSQESGLAVATPILYRAGDQPNNALSLNVFLPGEVAATGGTSGVMYAITDNLSAKECSRVNNFAHVNYRSKKTRTIGKLLCINGAGIQYRWLMNNLSVTSYEEMNQLASEVEIGSEGVCILPFGNGAERMLLHADIGTRIVNLNLNRHHKGHLCRAALEGIAFSFVYGFEIMQSDGIRPTVIRAGNDNLFRSEIFSNTLTTLIGQQIEIYDTTGAIGAARACVLIDDDYQQFASFTKDDHVLTYMPKKEKAAYGDAYEKWKKELNLILKH
ncbi:FGGY family carbohydrate kinase [Muricauda sp. SCSIO 64092]|uniref:xylulokinase n=1 Tax=Allomuricauda sp. SCSIO 64092 TaxID=2908842 RepID=UPI001FF3EC68|nr:FGGY family carbohydrate kinase [Muricauda sp. SCSIO 64092]UOY08138.1 FGGY family carbohydrate kinase [Muricauda sp. SCSIO 64092]